MAPPNTFNDNTLLRQALYDLLANDTELFNLIVQTNLNASEWLVGSWTPSYVADDQFTLPGDHTSIYTEGRKVRAHIDSGYVYSYVIENSFSVGTGETTITLADSVLDGSLDEAAFGIISPNPSTSLPVENPTLVRPIPLINWQTDPDQYTVLAQDSEDYDGKGADLFYKYVFPAGTWTCMYCEVIIPYTGYDLQLAFPFRMSSSFDGNVEWGIYYKVIGADQSAMEIENWADWATSYDDSIFSVVNPSAIANQRNIISGTDLVIPASVITEPYCTLQLALARNIGGGNDTHEGDAEASDTFILIPTLP